VCTDADADGDCDLHCGIVPSTGCRVAEAGKSKILIKDLEDDSRDSVKWKWGRGAQTAVEDFLDPVTGTADYHFCIYDESDARQPLLEASIPPGGQCGDAACWKATGTKGFAYGDDAGTRRGITKIKLKSGDTGKAQVQLLAKGENVGPPTPELAGTVTVQLVARNAGQEECWQTAYTVATKNKGGASAIYKASGP
jgi:hypothetical protein